VTYEALAAGLPVVATPNAGSVVEDGTSGFIVPLGDTGAIVAALQRLGDERTLDAMSRAAVARAAEFDLAAYGRRLLAALAPLRDAA
jgi:glycosyltransferase involved in cell wall biosynthesis